MIVFALIFLAFHLFTAINPIPYLWGFDSWSILPDFAAVLLFLFGAAAILPPARKAFRESVDNLEKFSAKVPVIIWLIIFASVFYLLRQSVPMIGDGPLRIRNAEGGVLIIAAEPLDTFIHTFAYQQLNNYFNIGAEKVIEWISIVAGLGAVSGSFLYLRKIFDRRNYANFTGLILFSSGTVLLFFGYVESYTILAAFIILFLLSSLHMLREKRFKITPAVYLALGMIFHPLGILMIPALLFAYYQVIKSKENKLTLWLIIISIFIASAAVLSSISLASGKNPLEIIADLTADSHILAPFSTDYGIISWQHFLDIINQIALTVPPIIALPLIINNYKSIEIGDDIKFLYWAAGGGIFLLLFFQSDLGFSRDWDLFAVSSLPLLILIAFMIIKLSQKDLYRYSFTIILISLLHTIPWIILNSDEDAVISRAERLAETPWWTGHAKANFHDELAVYYFEQENKEKAYEHFKLAYQNEASERLLFSYAGAAYKTNRLQEAAQLYHKLLPTGYSEQQVNNFLAEIYFNMDSLAQSEKYFKNVIRINPNKTNALFNLGVINNELGDYAESIRYFENVTRLDPAREDAWIYLGVLHFSTGNYPKALEIFQKVLEFRPRDPKVFYNLASIHSAMGNYRQALDLIQKAANLNILNDNLRQLNEDILKTMEEAR